jgi:hypothetical protein
VSLRDRSGFGRQLSSAAESALAFSDFAAARPAEAAFASSLRTGLLRHNALRFCVTPSTKADAAFPDHVIRVSMNKRRVPIHGCRTNELKHRKLGPRSKRKS